MDEPEPDEDPEPGQEDPEPGQEDPEPGQEDQEPGQEDQEPEEDPAIENLELEISGDNNIVVIGGDANADPYN